MNMFEWEEDNFSFEDSDRFEEVSKDYYLEYSTRYKAL